MKIALTGSLGNISKPLATKLIGAGHQVTIISSDENKADAIKALGGTPAIGSVDDVEFVTKAFDGADAVYTMVPPDFGATNYREYIARIGRVYAEAIKNSGIKKVVNLSSIGAHLPSGTGPIAGLYDVENIFAGLDGVAIKHLRAAYFYVNFYANVDMIKHAGILGSNHDADTHLVLVHPNDIADAAAEELQHDFTGKSIRYVSSDERTAGDVAKVLGSAIGKPELPWVEFSDEDNYNGMIQAGLTEEVARVYTEMGASTRSGKLYEHYFANKPAQLGETKLEDFAVEFAKAF